MARRIAVGPTVALGLIRQNLRVGQEKSFHEVLECEARAQCVAASTTDATEGARAFFAKRLPQFKGN
jgi:2-(1,2-epoxy-1,2-dihydrophenyl)acetyl-CoA isomerase